MAQDKFGGSLVSTDGFGGQLVDDKSPDSPSRTTGEAIKDVGLGLAQGAAGLVKTAGDAYGLLAGDMDNAVSKTAGGWQESLDKEKSPGFQARAARRKANIDAQDSTLGKAWTAVKDTVTDPALALDTVATNAATLLPPLAVGRAVAGGVRAAQVARAGLAGDAIAAATQAGKAGTAYAAGNPILMLPIPLSKIASTKPPCTRCSKTLNPLATRCRARAAPIPRSSRANY